MNVPHLTVYFDREHADRDGKGFCIDHDLPDVDGQRQGGNVGQRFETATAAGQYVAAQLVQMENDDANRRSG
jgi:hypothetical protein